ncbi:MAG: bifunctional pyr operon transcriptional regulator/uracil phosphoribosyltransferase [Deltaproteobacteria bacterium RIFCSPLOWO2_12_FULL_50_11]|nr:MAG: bifunctional pyr operon transcriptional regulator/uracil phosphoribosyltransferase [Deltaproteobacteria bacterium RIFCSPHIGHO2_02_FULL_50_15]OGQ67937.1 MAG: bifunctional pyr operon transcriptional regulator/uracil phosphoribosyltransferase [Deltaproteobacteria bacterium RIFCSPLOWO2_12_FULL_50_11]
MPEKTILDSKQLQKTLNSLVKSIIHDSKKYSNIALVGIQTRGVDIAQRLSVALSQKLGKKIPVGILDITLYRDDLSQVAEQPIIRDTHITFSIDKMDVFLVDDVLFTGRTIRAALSALNDLGRPRVTRLVVLIDRGGRELPIQADYVGKKVVSMPKDNIKVSLKERDGRDGVSVI